MMNITSKDNKILKHTKKLASASYRAKAGEFIAEGGRLCDEALLRVERTGFARADISYAIAAEDFLAENPNFQKRLDDLNICVYTVSDKLFASVSQTTAPQGILLAVRMPEIKEPDFSDITRVLILDGISEPGNMGTIIRTADAFGFSAILLVNDCVDVYNPKVVRSTMGGIFRIRAVPVSPARTLTYGTSAIDEIFGKLKAAGFQIIAAALENAEDISAFNFGEKCALIIGNETNGVSDELLNLSDARVKIPMTDGVESLNAAVAAGILMWTGR